MKVNAASAVVPTASHETAIATIATGLRDELFGPILMEHVQLCPQHAGYLDERLIEKLSESYPQTAFRLHASPKIRGETREIVYASNADRHQAYFDRADRLGQIMRSPAYTIHAGRRDHCDMKSMLEQLDRVQDRTGVRIGVEGLYPTASDKWLMADWSEYEMVAEMGYYYALDLSHLNIVAKRKGRNDRLVESLIADALCIEIHVSANDGRADSHKPMSGADIPWWYPLMSKANPDATIFYEGVLVQPRRRENRIGLDVVGEGRLAVSTFPS